MNEMYLKCKLIVICFLLLLSKSYAQPDFSFPWPVGEVRWLHWGAHDNDCTGTCNTCDGEDNIWSSLDFGHFENGPIEVRPAAAGVVEVVNGSNNIVVIKHVVGEENWYTGYYHLKDVPGSLNVGDAVNRSTFIGNSSTETNGGGSAENPHVHFSVRKGGVNEHYDITGMYIGGYKINDHNCHRLGKLTRRAKGNDQTLKTFSIIPDGEKAPYGLGDIQVTAVIMNDGVKGRYKLFENLPIHGLSNPDVTLSFGAPVVASNHISIEPPFKISSLTSFLLNAEINPLNDAYKVEKLDSYRKSKGEILNSKVDTKPLGLKITKDVISIFPNPTKVEISIQAEKNLPISNIELYHIDGSLMKTWDGFKTGDLYKLSIEEIPEGVYILKVLSGDNIYSSKIMKI